MDFIKNNLKFLPLILLVVYIILNQIGCVGREIEKEVTVRDTIYQVQHDSFLVRIPVPIEKKIYVKVKEEVKDSFEGVYAKRINDLERSIVEYKNAIRKIKETPEEPIEITANMYDTTIVADTYDLGVTIGVIGHLESFEYKLKQFEKKCPDPPKLKKNAILFGIEADFRGLMTPKLGYGKNNLYVKFGYTVNHPKGQSIKNGSVEIGGITRF